MNIRKKIIIFPSEVENMQLTVQGQASSHPSFFFSVFFFLFRFFKWLLSLKQGKQYKRAILTSQQDEKQKEIRNSKITLEKKRAEHKTTQTARE